MINIPCCPCSRRPSCSSDLDYHRVGSASANLPSPLDASELGHASHHDGHDAPSRDFGDVDDRYCGLRPRRDPTIVVDRWSDLAGVAGSCPRDGGRGVARSTALDAGGGLSLSATSVGSEVNACDTHRDAVETPTSGLGERLLRRTGLGASRRSRSDRSSSRRGRFEGYTAPGGGDRASRWRAISI